MPEQQTPQKMVAPTKSLDFSLLADLPDLLPVVARWYFDEWGHKQPNNSFEATCERITGKLHRDKAPLHVLALRDDDLLGVAQLKLHEMEAYPDKEFWLGSVFVLPAARDQGVAYSLSLKVAEVAQSLGVKELHLSTDNLDGGVYTRAGWKPFDRTVSRADQVLVMVKTLSV